jgi:hypothetical protein
MWLTRVARNHLVRFYAFCSANFDGCEFWNRDLDLHLPGLIRTRIQSKCSLGNEDIDRMILHSLYPNLSLHIDRTKAFWLTPLSFYSNNRAHLAGISICPDCLKKDGDTAYYRIAWRNAMTTVCVNCGKYLIDQCPWCKAKINYILAERGKKFQAHLFPITCCWNCLSSLLDAPTKPASITSLSIQTTLNDYLTNGCAESRGLQYSHLYFDVLKKVISLLNKPNTLPLVKMQRLISRRGNFHFHKPLDNRTHPFNSLSINSRRELVEKAFWLLEEWPERFRKITTDCGLKSKYFLNDFQEAPYWFRSEIENHNRVVFFEWRKSYRDFSYSSFNEMSDWQVSKAAHHKRVAENIRKTKRKKAKEH